VSPPGPFDDPRVVRRIVRSEHAMIDREAWPATIPAVAALLDEGLDLSPGVTLLVGENGSGKSTLAEAVAMAFGLSPEGGTRFGRHSTHASESPLHEWIRLERSPGPPGGASSCGQRRCTATTPTWRGTPGPPAIRASTR
jgi:predicted ATPase